MSCHAPGAPVAGRSRVQTRTPLPARLRVLLVGGPNVGKSTLFNSLTGARQHTTNAPGTTVELANGIWRTTAQDTAEATIERTIVDLPGSYSLLARSSDEQVTADAVQELAQSSGEVGGRGSSSSSWMQPLSRARSTFWLRLPRQACPLSWP
jgi:ferrous iron transport protein B